MAKQREKTTPASDINQTSAPVAKKSKPARRSEEGLRARKESDRLRVKTRVNISYSFSRWRKLKEERKLRTDGDVADYLLNFYEKRSSILMTSTGTCMQEPTALSNLQHVSASRRGKQRQQDNVKQERETTQMASEVNGLQDSFEEMDVTIDNSLNNECTSVKNRLSDLKSDGENISETTELSAPGADDNCNEDVYVPIIPQRAKTSEFLLKCEEEELQPWQKHILQVRVKEEQEEHDVGESNDDQTECKPEPSSLQIRSTGEHKPTSEPYGGVNTSEVPQSNIPVSSSSVQSPDVVTTLSN